MSHHRVAAGYLRTGNLDLATLEIEGLREAWAKISTLPRPAAFRNQERYTSTVLQVAAQLVGISLVINLGRPDVARESLDNIRKMLSDLRRYHATHLLWKPDTLPTPERLATMSREAKDVETAAYEPKMNVTPNAVALKE